MNKKYNKKKLDYTMLDIAIPKSVENLQLPDAALITYYKNLENRILWLDSEVDDYFLEYGKYILQWNQEDAGKPIEERKPIRLLFFSPGGSLDINNAMIDIIKQSKTKVIGINMGIAQSAGAFIYLACHERLTMPKAGFLLHRGSGNFGGTYDEIICQVMEYQRQMEELEKYVLANTKLDEETFADNFGTEWFISAKDAVDYGIAHKIITDIDEIYL
jgi:ATP-dependent Clp protease protease subunit